MNLVGRTVVEPQMKLARDIPSWISFRYVNKENGMRWAWVCTWPNRQMPGPGLAVPHNAHEIKAFRG